MMCRQCLAEKSEDMGFRSHGGMKFNINFREFVKAPGVWKHKNGKHYAKKRFIQAVEEGMAAGLKEEDIFNLEKDRSIYGWKQWWRVDNLRPEFVATMPHIFKQAAAEEPEEPQEAVTEDEGEAAAEAL